MEGKEKMRGYVTAMEIGVMLECMRNELMKADRAETAGDRFAYLLRARSAATRISKELTTLAYRAKSEDRDEKATALVRTIGR